MRIIPYIDPRTRYPRRWASVLAEAMRLSRDGRSRTVVWRGGAFAVVPSGSTRAGDEVLHVVGDSDDDCCGAEIPVAAAIRSAAAVQITEAVASAVTEEWHTSEEIVASASAIYGRPLARSTVGVRLRSMRRDGRIEERIFRDSPSSRFASRQYRRADRRGGRHDS